LKFHAGGIAVPVNNRQLEAFHPDVAGGRWDGRELV